MDWNRGKKKSSKCKKESGNFPPKFDLFRMEEITKLTKQKKGIRGFSSNAGGEKIRQPKLENPILENPTQLNTKLLNTKYINQSYQDNNNNININNTYRCDEMDSIDKIDRKKIKAELKNS